MLRFITKLTFLAALLLASIASADHRVGDICRIKGQEENILHGFGLVTGLKGTGDSDMKATQRAAGSLHGAAGSSHWQWTERSDAIR